MGRQAHSPSGPAPTSAWHHTCCPSRARFPALIISTPPPGPLCSYTIELFLLLNVQAMPSQGPFLLCHSSSFCPPLLWRLALIPIPCLSGGPPPYAAAPIMGSPRICPRLPWTCGLSPKQGSYMVGTPSLFTYFLTLLLSSVLASGLY